MEEINRFTAVFNFVFDKENPLIFTQFNFWLFFLAVMLVYAALDWSARWKTLTALLIAGFGFVAGQFQWLGLGILFLGGWYYLLQEKGLKFSKIRLYGVLLTGVLILYAVLKNTFGSVVIGLTEWDIWLSFLVLVFLFARYGDSFLVRSFFLAAVSLFFYYKSSGLYVILLFISLIFNFYVGRALYHSPSKIKQKWWIGLSVTFNILILSYFKYAYFFTESFNNLFHTDMQVVNHFARLGNTFFGEGSFIDKIILPVGVSFFTFQSISYVVDVYRKEIKPVKHFFHYAFFVTYFPQLVAGPIVRARDFIPQITQPFLLRNKDFSWAIFQIVKGLMKKIVLADYIAIHFIDKVADAPDAYPGFVSILAMWGYSLQIYGDFSGYTDIAIGLSRLMGFNLLENFNSPYKALNVADFWRRWHKSLGTWLRDYLYIPLGGNRTGGFGTYLATLIVFLFLLFITQWYELIFIYLALTVLYLYGWLFIPRFKYYVHRDLNLIITMVIGGLWHGASTNFVIWGAMNGVALVLYKYWKMVNPYENSQRLIVRFWRIFLTFNFITFTRIWFRLEEDGMPALMVDQIFNHFDFNWSVFVKVLETFSSVFWVMLLGYFLHWMPQRWKDEGMLRFEHMPIYAKAVGVSIAIVVIYQAVSDVSKPFVYFQF